jgi:hypothetical protein
MITAIQEPRSKRAKAFAEFHCDLHKNQPPNSGKQYIYIWAKRGYIVLTYDPVGQGELSSIAIARRIS